MASTGSKDCGSDNCDVHLFMIETVKELKAGYLALLQSHSDLKEVVVKLTENMGETRRIYQRLDKILEDAKEREENQDKKIEENKKYIDRAIGGIIIANVILVPIVTSLIVHFIEF